jgi:hypothetical protein
MNTSRELFERLSGDAWRISHPFSDDLLQANALLHNTAATEEEMAECARLWCQRRQPCQFGKVAASDGRIHFCFLTEQAVSTWSDEEIAEKIAEEKQLWKQRGAFDPTRGAHSFVLVVASHRVAFAAPDQHLRAFSDHILELAGWESDRRGLRRKNTVTSDFLYLKHPSDGGFYGFRFNADFFACAGDNRWWHDHRFPGGIAFTANSTGHMIAAREWYQGKQDVRSWALIQAMLTINNAMPTRNKKGNSPAEQGRVTWLRSLDANGKPFVQNSCCPVARLPRPLEGMDWTRYEGLLHTDHAVREEFFFDRDVAPTASKPYLMDFTYLFDDQQDDFVQFTGGERFLAEHVFAEIGRPEDWIHRTTAALLSRSDAEARTVAEQLQACQRWKTAFDLDEMDFG